MRIALIGAGIIGSAHAPRLASFSEVTELLIADDTLTKAEKLAESVPKAKAVSPAEAFSSDVDGIVVTANTNSHARLIHEALDAKIPVFSEKPVALDIATTREVVDHALREPGTPVQIGFQRRFDAGYNTAKKLYRSGELGFVHTLFATTMDEAPPPAAYIPTSGGLFKDCSVHDFDIIHWLTGLTATRVYATGSNMGASFFTEGGDVDSCQSMVTYDNGMVALVGASRYNGAGHDVRLELFGSESGRFVGLNDRAPLISAEESVSWTQSEPYHAYHERFADCYLAELKYFLDVVSGKRPSACTPSDALEALYITEACGLSMQRGEPVEIAEVRES